ncbi:MAG: rhodanese-like domain-containing protein [Spirochaetales bacterium]|nr:rhodanese-like domain-containing protein [Spirochaetales bacterium]
MKVISVIFLSLLVAFSVSATGKSEEVSGPSGAVEGGLRVLEVADGSDQLNYTIYRGDYIVFNFAEDGSFDFTVPELEINEVVPKPEGETSYIKMKKSGDYSFTLGDRRGVFHILELESQNYHELSASEASDLIENVKPLVLDVRTKSEFDSGHISGANLLPVQVFAENIDRLAEYKDQDILLYCASGNRSTVAAKMLIDAGFSRVYNLRHGIGDWVRNALPVE